MTWEKENTKCNSNHFLTNYYFTLTNSFILQQYLVIQCTNIHFSSHGSQWQKWHTCTRAHTHTHARTYFRYNLASQWTYNKIILCSSSAHQLCCTDAQWEAKSEPVLILRWDDLQWHLKGCVHGCRLGLHRFLSPFNMSFWNSCQ